MADFTKEEIDSVWRKAQPILGHDSKNERKDVCGAWIRLKDYGKRSSNYGWEIDHILPESRLKACGVPTKLINYIDNLQPLHYKNNISKDDDYPTFKAHATSLWNFNFWCIKQMTIPIDIQYMLLDLYKDYNIQ